MKTSSLVLCLAVGLVSSGCADPLRSRNLSDPSVPAVVLARQVCSNCHGVDGEAPSPNFPRLAGQSAGYLAASLKAFRERSRSDPAARQYMWGLARDLSDGQIEGLARYYAAQPPAAPAPEASAERVLAGRALWERGLPERQVIACAVCHDAQAQGQGQGVAAFPRLAGQHPHYFAMQLKVFRHGGERSDGGVMEGVARQLTDEQIDDLAAYAGSLRGVRAAESDGPPAVAGGS